MNYAFLISYFLFSILIVGRNTEDNKNESIDLLNRLYEERSKIIQKKFNAEGITKSFIKFKVFKKDFILYIKTLN